MMTDGQRRKGRGGWLVAAALGLAGGYGLATLQFGADPHRHAVQDLSVEETSDAAAGGQQLYTCSMHPQVRATNPNDKCPICGMHLIPIAAADDDWGDDSEPGPRLRLTPRSAALMQIEVLPAQRRTVPMPVRLFGRMEPDETRLRTIAAWVPGRLERLHVDFTGLAVRQGQPMVELYSPQLIAAQEELLQALKAARELEFAGVGAVRDTTRLTVEASRDRLRLLGLDSGYIEQLERHGQTADRVIIPAPVSGVVIERLATQGDYVETGQPIYRLADLSVLWTQLEVYEIDLPWLRPGQRALFGTQSDPGRQFEGTVSFIDPTINERTRTARVRLEIPNPDGRLKPGMFVRGVVGAGLETSGAQPPHDAHGAPGSGADHHTPATDPAVETAPLMIPTSAPLITGRRAVVYVQLPGEDHPTFEPRDVLLGPRAGDWYRVDEGLDEGELVVTHGAFKIDAELQIRGRPSMMQPEGGAAPVHDHGGHGS
ncbi:MAG: efflux RND transporter periplasmic adaptor subunit [Gammaproteobacteria bacterium]